MQRKNAERVQGQRIEQHPEIVKRRGDPHRVDCAVELVQALAEPDGKHPGTSLCDHIGEHGAVPQRVVGAMQRGAGEAPHEPQGGNQQQSPAHVLRRNVRSFSCGYAQQRTVSGQGKHAPSQHDEVGGTWMEAMTGAHGRHACHQGGRGPRGGLMRQVEPVTRGRPVPITQGT